MTTRIKAFLLQIVVQKFPKFGTSEAEVDTEAPVQPMGLVAELKNMDWAMVVVAVCFTSAVDLALLSLQIDSRQFPLIFYLFSLTILFGLASLVLSKFINSKFPSTAQALEGASVFFVVTAFFIAITIPFPLCLKFVAWTVYAICLLLIIICNRC
ncbi:hypothetical protein FNV43_RR20728 [Rhamnella rubrinervis]|uniref:Transmembrane protein n=1 Tax=Rhamnella rubrinervis TaxID=2594499 RepID=A0A8K0DUY1_9ROSA|nr:hypothetical protein FNV43_RR20728 [Rhamnella rubrinervis]